MLTVHLTIALLSIIAVTFAVISPSTKTIKGSQWLVVLTVVSGTYLVIKSHSPMLASCLTGLAYIGASLVVLAFAKNRLAKQDVQTLDDD